MKLQINKAQFREYLISFSQEVSHLDISKLTLGEQSYSIITGFMSMAVDAWLIFPRSVDISLAIMLITPCHLQFLVLIANNY